MITALPLSGVIPLKTKNPACMLAASLDDTVIIAHFIFTANHRPFLVNCTHHSGSIQSCAPAVIQSLHRHSAPSVDLDKAIGHTGVGKQQYLQTAATGLAISTAYFGIWHNSLLVNFITLPLLVFVPAVPALRQTLL